MLSNYIITGTSGTGKTTLIKYLQNQGQSTVQEPIRKVLQEQLKEDGEALPSKNPNLFLKELFDFSIRQIQITKKQKKTVFFDRGSSRSSGLRSTFQSNPVTF